MDIPHRVSFAAAKIAAVVAWSALAAQLQVSTSWRIGEPSIRQQIGYEGIKVKPQHKPPRPLIASRSLAIRCGIRYTDKESGACEGLWGEVTAQLFEKK